VNIAGGSHAQGAEDQAARADTVLRERGYQAGNADGEEPRDFARRLQDTHLHGVHAEHIRDIVKKYNRVDTKSISK